MIYFLKSIKEVFFLKKWRAAARVAVQQASLPLREGGCGLTSAVETSEAASCSLEHLGWYAICAACLGLLRSLRSEEDLVSGEQ